MASWVTNNGAWYAPPTTSDDAGVLSSFSRFIVDFSDTSLQRFFQLSPVSDFEHMVSLNTSLTSHYYRAAQINRDIWFTCPVLDLTWQYFRHHHHHGSPGVRLYEMNQTRFEPVFKRLGIDFWRVSHVSDIPYMLNGHVAGGGDNSPDQKELARLLSGSVAAFAYSGDATVSDHEVLQDWLVAYSRDDEGGLEKEFPHSLTVNVMGGDARDMTSDCVKGEIGRCRGFFLATNGGGGMGEFDREVPVY